MKNKLPSHLVIGDPHASPFYDNDRFTALGNYIVEEQPSTIICIGDFGDMPSLSSYDKGKRSFEGRRYRDDCLAVIDAQHKLFAPIAKHNKYLLAQKKATYKPRKVMVLGNHDGGRIIRVTDDQPELAGTIGIHDLKYDEFGWEVYPFQVPALVDSISYCHYFVSGVAGRPISGENIARTMCMKLHSSSVQGHSHVLDHAERTIISGNKIFGLSCGCFTHKDMIEGWNVATHSLWWRGIVVLQDLDGAGYYDAIKMVTQRKLLREYL